MTQRPFRLWWPVVLYMAAIFLVSSLHTAPLPSGVSDKPAHALAYVGLAGLVARALGRGLPPQLTVVHLAIGFAMTMAYAASDEFHQWFVPGRSADVADLAADATGAAIALIACWAWGIIAPRGE